MLIHVIQKFFSTRAFVLHMLQCKLLSTDTCFPIATRHMGTDLVDQRHALKTNARNQTVTCYSFSVKNDDE